MLAVFPVSFALIRQLWLVNVLLIFSPSHIISLKTISNLCDTGLKTY